MLKVSSTSITFNQNQSIKSLILQNLFDTNIIFKIKVNAIGTINIEPNRGFIRSNSSVSFIIKSIKKQIFQVKVLFTYGFIDNKSGDFNQQWEKIKEKTKFQHQIINFKRVEEHKQNQIKEGGGVNFKNSQQNTKIRRQMGNNANNQATRNKNQQKRIQCKSLSLTKIRNISPNKTFNSSISSFLRLSNTKNKIASNQLIQQYSKQTFLQQQQPTQNAIYTSQQLQQVIQDLHESMKNLQLQKIKNIKISQQLSISEAKLKQITQDKMHIEVHKTIGIVCEEYHMSFTLLVVLGLICFVVGFSLGKIQAEIV